MTKNEKFEAIIAFLETLQPACFNSECCLVMPFHIVQRYQVEKPLVADVYGWLPAIFPDDYKWVVIHDQRIEVNRHLYLFKDPAISLAQFLDVDIKHVDALFFGYRTLQHQAGLPFTNPRDFKAVKDMFKIYYNRHINPSTPYEI